MTRTISATTAAIIAMRRQHVLGTATVPWREAANVTTTFSPRLALRIVMQLQTAMAMGAAPMVLCRHAFVTSTITVSIAIYTAFLQHSVYATFMAAVTAHRHTMAQRVTCIATR